MGIGASVFLIALGAILTFALHVTVAGINLDTVGIVLMAAGALGLIITVIMLSTHRRSLVVSRKTGGGMPEEVTTKETVDPPASTLV